MSRHTGYNLPRPPRPAWWKWPVNGPKPEPRRKHGPPRPPKETLALPTVPTPQKLERIGHEMTPEEFGRRVKERREKKRLAWVKKLREIGVELVEDENWPDNEIASHATKLYTDGSCFRGGYGGWAALIVDSRGRERLIDGCQLETSSQAMELRAIREGLLAIEPKSRVVVMTDFRDYVLNHPLWFHGHILPHVALVEDAKVRHATVEVRWVPAHFGNRIHDRVDLAARKAAQRLQAEWSRSHKT